MVSVDHHKHLIFRVVRTDECQSYRTVIVGNLSDFQRILNGIQGKLGESLSRIGPFFHDM